MPLGPPDVPIHEPQAPVELCGGLVFPPVAGCDHLHRGVELEPPNYFEHGSSAVALSLEALVDHQATDEADSRAELVHRKTNHRHFRLLEAPGHDVIDGQGNEIQVRCSLLQGLQVWSYPPRLRLSHTQIEVLCPVILTDFMQADLSH